LMPSLRLELQTLASYTPQQKRWDGMLRGTNMPDLSFSIHNTNSYTTFI